MKRVLLLLALAGCAHTYCRTRCGLALLQPSACEPLQAQEDVALRTFEGLHDDAGASFFPYARSCAALEGYRVGIPPGIRDGGVELVWTDAWGRTVAGETNCDLRRIAVTGTNWHSQSNALTHELVHAIEHCQDGPHGESHWQWFERGITDAVERARPEP